MLIIIRGVSGSGKSTLAHRLMLGILEENKDVVHLAADDYMVNDKGEYAFDPKRLPEVHQKCIEDARHFLDQDYTVIVHNTFTRKWEYQGYVDYAKHKNLPIQIITVEGDFQNIHGVPPETIQKQKERFEK